MPKEDYFEILVKRERLAADRWEAIRLNENYRKDWDASFHAYLNRIGLDLNRVLQVLDELYPLLIGEEPNLPERLGVKVEFEAINEFFWKSPEGLEVAQKYDLPIPQWYGFASHHGEFPPWLWPPMWPIEQDKAVKVISHAEEQIIETAKEIIINYSPHLENKRYIILKIDLQKTKTEIMAELEHYVDFYMPLATVPKTIEKKTELNPFEVWGKVHEIAGRNEVTEEEAHRFLWTLAKKANPRDAYDAKEEILSYSEKVRTYYNKLKRAYHKAAKAINLINPS